MIHIVEYDPVWPTRFAEIGAQLRRALGEVALRIDHIGSTSVPGLAAKPIVDVQVSVGRLEPVAPFRDPLVGIGLVYRAGNPERQRSQRRKPAQTQPTKTAAPPPTAPPKVKRRKRSDEITTRRTGAHTRPTDAPQRSNRIAQRLYGLLTIVRRQGLEPRTRG